MFSSKTLRVRTRLTLWYSLVVAAALLLYTAGTAFFLYRQLHAQLTRFAVEDIETIEGLLFFDARGRLALNESYHNHPQSRQVQERLLEVLSPTGQLLFRNERLGGRMLGGSPSAREGVNGYSQRRLVLSDGARVLAVSRRHVLDGQALLIRLAYDEEIIWSRVRESVTAALAALPLVLLLAGFAAYQMARKALAPLEQMASRAERITAANLDERLPPGNPADEVGHMARVFNDVLARLERSFEQLERFTSDASHELRTPLAAMRSVGEVGLQKNRTAKDYQETISSMLEELSRLTQLVDALLNLARPDMRRAQHAFAAVSPLAVVRETAATIDVLLEEKQLQLRVTGDAQVFIHGDRLLLRQALMNVLHNAVKYSPAFGSIVVDVRSRADAAVIRITDAGPGILPEHREKVFDRFYRIDPARNRNTGGAGLGLSIAKWAVEVQGGSIAIDDSAQGASFRIELPLSHGKYSYLT